MHNNNVLVNYDYLAVVVTSEYYPLASLDEQQAVLDYLTSEGYLPDGVTVVGSHQIIDNEPYRTVILWAESGTAVPAYVKQRVQSVAENLPSDFVRSVKVTGERSGDPTDAMDALRLMSFQTMMRAYRVPGFDGVEAPMGVMWLNHHNLVTKLVALKDLPLGFYVHDAEATDQPWVGAFRGRAEAEEFAASTDQDGDDRIILVDRPKQR